MAQAKKKLKELPELLDVTQVASYLRLGRATVLDYARKGKLRGFKVGREWRFRANEIQTWLEWKKQEDFAARVDRLWDKIRRRAEAAGYTADDVEELVRSVREERRKAKATTSA